MQRSDVQLLVSVLQQNFAGRSGPLIEEGTRVSPDALLFAAFEHGVVPLAYRSLVGNLTPHIPVSEEFRNTVRLQSVQSCVLAAELAELFGAFAKCGIKALALKGPALSAFIYGDPVIRKSSDLDVLVRKLDLDRASSLLLSQGYLELTRDRSQKHRRYYREADGITIELHWSFHDAEMHVRIAEHEIWKRMQTVSICGQDIGVASLEDTLLYLCIHGKWHRWQRLKWVYDIAQLIFCSERIDTTMLLSRANRHGCRRMLVVGVALASCLLGVRLPNELALAFRNDRVAQLLVEKARHDLLSMRQADDDEFESTRYRERLRDRLVFLKDKWRPNSADALAFPLPPKLSFLHYFTRPVRLAMVYGRGWMRPILWDRPG